MRKVTKAQLLDALRPQFRGPVSSTDLAFTGIGTDTRKDLSGQLFWALKGEVFDAHDYLSRAVDSKAAGFVVHDWNEQAQEISKKYPVFLVDDTLVALQKFANWSRKQAKYKLIGITGSNGKTSTKEFLGTLLKNNFKTHWNPGSFNNHFGLPFNILEAPIDTEILIAEMGMNHVGEIKRLCEIAEPDIVSCTMVGSAHIEHFGSQEKIAEAKNEIYQYAKSKALRIFNFDSALTRKMALKSQENFPLADHNFFSLNQDHLEDAKIQVVLSLKAADMQGLHLIGRIGDVLGQVKVPVFGPHNTLNIAAAAAMALAAGLPSEVIWERLTLCGSSWGRTQLLRNKSGVRILFDGYNANPESMMALFESLKSIQYSGQAVAVLANMQELGELAQIEHERLGSLAAKMKFSKLWFYGSNSLDFKKGFESVLENKNSLVVSSDYNLELAMEIKNMLSPEDIVVVKGSRGMSTERFVEILEPLNWHKKKS